MKQMRFALFSFLILFAGITYGMKSDIQETIVERIIGENELKEHAKNYEQIIENRDKIIDDLNEKIKNLEPDKTELINLKNEVDANHGCAVPVAPHQEDWKTKYDDLMEDYMTYYYHVRDKVADASEHLADAMEIIDQGQMNDIKRREMISQAKEQIEQLKKELSFSSFLKPFAMISATMISVAILVSIVKKGLDCFKQYCAKRRHRTQTTVTTQEITVFEIR